ncbi:CHAT domain-containing protein [Winogradskyella tangerina]|uniref:CHAT domain-containing protein n=1 Tax=Winogradskyella tangerina TaxID=2023240 RepID=UPI000DBE701A|nr:CHAT domain-containing protein [Winogradskyella tangerina]
MISKRLGYCITYLLLTFCATSYAQNDINLIELHKENLKDLYMKRGAPEEWVTSGEVSEDYLSWCIDHYEKKTALLVYSYENDSLKINLFDQSENRQYTSTLVDKESLIEHINNSNLYFSNSNGNSSPKLRGAVAKSVPNKKLRRSYKFVNQLLFPEKFELLTYEHIIIVPTLNISILPFYAFKINDSYLVDLMSYSIAPSLFELMVSNKVNQSDYFSKKMKYKWENALFTSNPKYPNDSIWEFPDLPGAEIEVKGITSNLEVDSYTLLSGENATKKNVIDAICDYDLLYFATHGISNSENPMENSFLVLAESDDSSPYLTLSEIMNLRHDCMLNADLVVLSACQTGLGKSHEGGIIGLARSFQIAGANHVLMSLWNISDSETATLMNFFFNELKIAKSLMPHEALRTAILKYKNEINDDPKHWAAFSIFGVPY